jgi:diacylglycerol kinase (ATP)
MARHGLGDDLVRTESEEDAIAAARESAERGDSIVAGAGGDGTVGTIAFQLLGSPTALGILPLGSAMNIARSLEIPFDLDGAAAIIREGQVRTIDVGEANGQPFLEVGSVGINAAVFAEAQRLDAGNYASFFGMFVAAARFRPARMRITLGDRVVATRALMVAVANTPYTGLGLSIAPSARLDDGLLDVRIFSGFSKLELARYVLSIMAGRRRYSPKVRTFRSATVHIETREPYPARADANDLGTTPVAFSVRPGILRVVAPAPGTAPPGTAAPGPPGARGADRSAGTLPPA